MIVAVLGNGLSGYVVGSRLAARRHRTGTHTEDKLERCITEPYMDISWRCVHVFGVIRHIRMNQRLPSELVELYDPAKMIKMQGIDLSVRIHGKYQLVIKQVARCSTRHTARSKLPMFRLM